MDDHPGTTHGRVDTLALPKVSGEERDLRLSVALTAGEHAHVLRQGSHGRAEQAGAIGRAGLAPRWVSALGWLSAAAHLLATLTVAQDGAFAPDGIIATPTPLTTVLWILALAATLPRSCRSRTYRFPG